MIPFHMVKSMGTKRLKRQTYANDANDKIWRMMRRDKQVENLTRVS